MRFQYLNGNYYVKLYGNGTKIYRALRVGEELVSSFPDSIDLKITDKCMIGCPFCHESSSPSGKEFDLDKTIAILDTLPKVGIEVAIGGGDVLEVDCEKFYKFYSWLENNKFVPRITVNIKSLEKKYNDANKEQYYLFPNLDLISSGFGISISEFNNHVIELVDNCIEITLSRGGIVFHVIAGIIPLEDLEDLLESSRNVLILGYKSWGRGEKFNPPISLKETGDLIKRFIYKTRLRRGLERSVGFDNLAIEQLGIKDSFTDTEWESMYMGDEFTHTMYIDAVKEEFAPTSRDPHRESWNKYPGGVLEYFQKNKR